jgi:hypothetical protein
MTSAFSPAADRRRAAEFLLAVLDGDVAAGVATLKGAGDGDELVCGLALGCLDLLMQAYGGPVGAREVLELEQLLDPSA